MSRRDRRRGPLARAAPILTLLAGACVPGAVWGQAPGAAPEGEALSDAIAGPLVEALSAELGGHDVDMHLDRVESLPMGEGASIISGTGTVRSLDRAGHTASFSFRLPWNSRLGQAGYPIVSVAGASHRHVPNDPVLVRRLESDVARKLASRTRQEAVSVRLDRIATVEGGTRLIRIDAQGVAYLHRTGGSRALTIQALYDRTRHSWQRLEYGLDEAAGTWVAK